MTWSWARIFNVYGPHEDPGRLVPSIVRALINDEGNSISVTNEHRDFLHVTDVARALVMLVESNFSGAVNIGSGKAVPIQEIVNQIALATGKQPRVSSTRTVTKVVHAQTDILTGTIGFKPRYTLQTGLTETTTWWLEQLAAKPQLFRSTI
jgi:nucleoside-diphosphate-sugar epimerase